MRRRFGRRSVLPSREVQRECGRSSVKARYHAIRGGTSAGRSGNEFSRRLCWLRLPRRDGRAPPENVSQSEGRTVAKRNVTGGRRGRRYSTTHHYGPTGGIEGATQATVIGRRPELWDARGTPEGRQRDANEAAATKDDGARLASKTVHGYMRTVLTEVASREKVTKLGARAATAPPFLAPLRAAVCLCAGGSHPLPSHRNHRYMG